MTIEYHSFLIRIWRDNTFGSVPRREWQGEAQHIQSGHCWRFDSVDDYLFVINVNDQDIGLKEKLEDQAGSNTPSLALKKAVKNEKKL